MIKKLKDNKELKIRINKVVKRLELDVYNLNNKKVLYETNNLIVPDGFNIVKELEKQIKEKERLIYMLKDGE